MAVFNMLLMCLEHAEGSEEQETEVKAHLFRMPPGLAVQRQLAGTKHDGLTWQHDIGIDTAYRRLSWRYQTSKLLNKDGWVPSLCRQYRNSSCSDHHNSCKHQHTPMRRYSTMSVQFSEVRERQDVQRRGKDA